METAVDWLQSRLKSLFEYDDNNFYKKLFKQAKEMEKQQIVEAYADGVRETHSRCECKNAEQYYNETFKNK